MGIKDNFLKAKEFAKKTTDIIKETASPVLETAKDRLEDASDFIEEKAESAKKSIVDKAEEISPEGVEKVREASEKVKSATNKAAEAVSETTEKAKKAIVDKAEDISPEGVEKIRETSDKVKEKTAEMNLLNSTLKKEAIEDLKKASEVYEQTYVDSVNLTVRFHESKIQSSKLLKDVEYFVNSIANSPKEIKNTVNEISIIRTAFDSLINELEIENEKAVKVSGGTAGAGVLAGAGVAAFGPTAAMAIATTFGTASTGAAISTLSGAAATKAALAWLGGGALSAGGGGVAAGNALLALAGPVGWTIGGVALVGSGLFLNHRNKKAATDAEEARKDIDNETYRLEKISAEINASQSQLDNHYNGLSMLLENLTALGKTDYGEFNTEEKFNLGSLVNTAKALSEFIDKGLKTDEQEDN
ncbi:MAG: hypothetical protein IK085_01685 [Clostridia bacterium]|nr:hypothetical protein [Clostridia bacterium]